MDTHPGYRWEGKGEPPKRVEVEDIPVDLANLPEISQATGARKRWIAATDLAQERKRKLWKRRS